MLILRLPGLLFRMGLVARLGELMPDIPLLSVPGLPYCVGLVAAYRRAGLTDVQTCASGYSERAGLTE